MTSVRRVVFQDLDGHDTNTVVLRLSKTNTYTNTYTNTKTNTYTNTYTHTSPNTYTNTYTNTNTNTYTNTNKQVYLTSVGGVVLQDLDGHDLVGTLLPTLGDLPESSSSEKLKDLILKGKTKRN